VAIRPAKSRILTICYSHGFATIFEKHFLIRVLTSS
jgi:hypothetical protein